MSTHSFGSSERHQSTIIALATPPGVGAIGVIRVSGPQAIEIVDGLWTGKRLTSQASHTAHVGLLKEGAQALDEVVVTLYRAPRSYTGEEVVEISCHGSPFIQQQVMEACMRRGATPARPGEFTQRAFLNGKLDLTQAEAVADLILSNTEASRRTALNNIRGGFSNELKVLRDRLIQFSALIELELDFSQEDVEFADRTALRKLLEEAKLQTGMLIRSFQLGNVIRNGVSVAIVGRPNAGKSTLLNALLNEDRAIVSEIPGTTRDTVEEVLNMDGILFRLIDTAGIREHTTDLIEGYGIEKSLKKMEEADIILYLFDVEETTAAALSVLQQEWKEKGWKYVMAGNKIDRSSEVVVREKFSGVEGLIFLSAQKLQHLEVLKEKLIDHVLAEGVNSESTIVTNARHYHSLMQVSGALEDIVSGLDQQIPSDLIALDIRRCLHFLGEITGEITTEDQLDYIFSKFCIGK